MIEKILNISDFFIHPKIIQTDDGKSLFKARIFVSIVLLVFVIFIINSIYAIYYNPNFLDSLYELSFLFIIVCFLFLVKRFGNLKLFVNLMCAIAIVILIVQVRERGGIYSSDLFWLALINCWITIITNFKFGVAWLIFTCLIYLGFFFYYDSDMNYDFIKKIGPFYVLVNLFAVNIAVFLFISLYELKSNALIKTIEANNQIILDKNKSINRSISYAKQIQTASLPKSNYIDTLFNSHYIFNRPKDVISGDFYAAYLVNGHTLFICADCTGHGIPAAMLNTFGITSLNQIILEKGITAPNLIIHELSLRLKYLFQSDQSEVKDGMDLAIISIEHATSTLTFFGAGRSAYIQRQLEIIELKKQTYGIGGIFKIESGPVTPNQIFQLEKNDCIYLFTDGITDQPNSMTGKKLSTKTLIQQIQTMERLPKTEKEPYFNTFMNDWIGNGKQFDDMLFICLVV